MNRILNIFFLILSINTNVYASGVISFLEDRITELHSDNTKTHYDLRDIIKYISFSHEDNNKLIAKYNRILFFIDTQYALSIVNFKLNNKLQLCESEKTLISQMNDIRENSKQIKITNITS